MARTASITARTSSAEPPSSAWMKLACLSETHAEPMRKPAQAEPVDQLAGAHLARDRVDEHRPGVLPARLVLAPPAHDLGDRRLGRRRGRRGASCSRRSTTTWSVGRGREPRKRRPSSAAAHVAQPRRRVVEVEHVDVDEHAAMSEPWPPAFIRTAPPIEPGTPTAHSKPVRPARRRRRASTGSGDADRRRTTTRPPRRSVDLDRSANRAEARHGDARRSRRRRRAGWSPGRRPAPAGPSRAGAAPTRREVVERLGARRTAPPARRRGTS